MDSKELAELWHLLCQRRPSDYERVYELARLAVCEIRETRSAMEALKEAMEACK